MEMLFPPPSLLLIFLLFFKFSISENWWGLVCNTRLRVMSIFGCKTMENVCKIVVCLEE